MLRINSGDNDDLAEVHPWLDQAAARLPPDLRHGMRVALEEAVMNVAMHGFPAGNPGEITIRLSRSPGSVALIVEDQGRAFDPTQAEPPLLPTSLLDVEPGGMGLILLRHYCGDISYQRRGCVNRLTLRFPLTPD
jgi:serine/threonine-protein kinase RsbW